MKQDELIANAQRIATLAHSDQFRNDGITPYISHPAAVVVKLGKSSPEIIATAWLHDVLEDTVISADYLRNQGIPERIVRAVIALTKTGHVQSYDEYVQCVRDDGIARRVKVADILHNLSDGPTERQILKYARALLILLPIEVKS